MADYDVQALALATPANPSPLDTYRPAIQVRNNGLYAAVATGTISAYKAGLKVYQSTVQSPSIAPGATGLATAADDWTPDEETDFVFYGYVTTNLDQVEPNNNLQPVTVSISGTPPPPPVTVPAHAQQHQAGGSDELSVDGLPGVLADPQDAAAHVASHQVGGSDQLSLDGLSGQAAEAQTPDTHGNEAHVPDMATSSELTTHATGTLRHAEATNLANRETSGPDIGLVPGAQLANTTEVPDAGDDPNKAGLRVGRDWGPTNAVHHAAKHAAGGLDPVAMPGTTSGLAQNVTCTPAGGQVTLVTCELTAAQAKPGTVCSFQAVGNVSTVVGAGQRVQFILFHQDGGMSTPIVTLQFALAALTNYTFHVDGKIGIAAAMAIAGTAHGEVSQIGAPAGEIHADAGAAIGLVAPAAASRFFLAVVWVGGAAGSSLNCSNAIGLGVSLI